MFFIDSHGGDCCGVYHLYQFPYRKWNKQDFQSFKSILEDLDKEARGSTVPDSDGFLIEVCLRNADQYKWAAEPLKEAGFKLVTKFVNPNTDETIVVLHRTGTGRCNSTAKPYRYNQPTPKKKKVVKPNVKRKTE